MWFEERSADTPLPGRWLSSAGARLQYTPGWAQFIERWVEVICGPRASLSLLTAGDARSPLLAAPLVRLGDGGPIPFPYDVRAALFDLWINQRERWDPGLRVAACLARGFEALLDAMNRGWGRALVVHAPLASCSDIMVADTLRAEPRLPTLLRRLFAHARAVAARESRILFVPRVDPANAALSAALADLLAVDTYPSAALDIDRAPGRRARQAVQRNRRLVERAGFVVSDAACAAPGFPFGALLARTALRHGGPHAALGDAFFHELAARFPDDVRCFTALRGGEGAGFVLAIRHRDDWEALRCGTDRALAGTVPIYLDLLFGRLPGLARSHGARRIVLGTGLLDLKARYGALVHPMRAYLALPAGFRLKKPLEGYATLVGRGITARTPGRVAHGARR